MVMMPTKPEVYVPSDKEMKYSDDECAAGWELVQSGHFKNAGIRHEYVITVKQPNGVIRDMRFDGKTIFKPFMIDAVIDDNIGTIEEWGKYKEKHLEVKLKARVDLKVYVLKWWETIGKDVDNPPMTASDYQDMMKGFIAGYVAAVTGEVEVS